MIPYEEVAVQSVLKLKSRLSQATEIASEHGTLVRPDTYTLAVEVLDEVVDELCQKTGKTEEEVLWDLKKELNQIRKVAEALLIVATILLPGPGEKRVM
jgi:hypothetical protein